jgi:hypothetical protein
VIHQVIDNLDRSVMRERERERETTQDITTQQVEKSM